MPTYTYLCDTCGAQFDRKRGFNDPALRKCPECGHKTLRKLFSPVGIVFKGPGFYSTDHPSGSRTNGAAKSEPKKTEDAGSAKPDSGKSSGSSPKPAKKTTSED